MTTPSFTMPLATPVGRVVLESDGDLLIGLWDRGLDNAGKTTIVKRIMGEDVNTVSPTLGFIIKTIDYEG